MAIVQVPASGALAAGVVVTATETAVDLGPAISGAAPANKVITVWPFGGVGRIRLRVGAGAGSLDATISAADTPGFVRSVTVPISGPGDYFWPSGRKSLALALRHVKTLAALKGDITPALMATRATIAKDAAAGVLGITQSAAEDGAKVAVVTNGPVAVACVGGWRAGDALCAAVGGALRKIADKETGLDRVAYAADDRADGESACPVTVELELV